MVVVLVSIPAAESGALEFLFLLLSDPCSQDHALVSRSYSIGARFDGARRHNGNYLRPALSEDLGHFYDGSLFEPMIDPKAQPEDPRELPPAIVFANPPDCSRACQDFEACCRAAVGDP